MFWVTRVKPLRGIWTQIPSIRVGQLTNWAIPSPIYNLYWFTWPSVVIWGGSGNPILGHGREALRWWPPFCGFSVWLGPYFIAQHNPINLPLFAEKIGLSLSHLVPETLGPKAGLIFHQNVLFNWFKAFLINFPLIFDPLFIDFKSFWPLIFTKPVFFRVLNTATENLMKYPHLPGTN